MTKKETKTSDSSQFRSSKGEVASLKLGKAYRNSLPKKSLISQFASVSIDSLELSPVLEVSNAAELTKKHVSTKLASISSESWDLSLMSEVSDGVHSDELAKKHVSSKLASVSNDCPYLPLISEVSSGVHSEKSCVVDPRYSASPDAFSLLELTPAAKITNDKHESFEDVSADFPHSGESISSNNRSVEADAIIQHLKSAWIQIQRSDAVDIQLKKLMETLINTVIELFYGIPEESDLPSNVLQAKTLIVVTCLLVWMICTLVAVYVKCRHTDTRLNGLLPT